MYNFAAIGYVIIVVSTIGMFILEYNGLGLMADASGPKVNNIMSLLGGTSEAPATTNNNFIQGSVQFFTDQSSFIIQLWLIGLILLSIRYMTGFNSNKILKKHSYPLGIEYLKTAKQLALKLGIRHSFKFRESEITKSPITIGWIKPLVLLPVGIASSMPYSEIETIIAHELAHLKRNDYFFKLIQAMFDIVLYFNPFTHWLSNVIQLEREKCCDEIAAKLTGDNTTAAPSRKFAPSLSLLGEGKKMLKNLKLLAAESDESKNPNRYGAIIILTTILCSMVVLAFTNSGTIPLSISDLQSGDSILDMLQLDSNIDEITKMLNDLEGSGKKSGKVNKNPDKTGAVPKTPEKYSNNISERYSPSLQSLGIDIDDLNGQADVYNKYLDNRGGNTMPGMEKLNKLEALGGEFDLQKLQLNMKKMNESMKNLREVIRGQKQAPIKK